MPLFRNKMNGGTLIAGVLVWWVASVSAMPRPKDYRNPAIAGSTGEVINNKYETGMNSEPSCEELKAMWRFSKRQSRAAEITNEIPTYRDPFSYNVWEPYYARSRSMGGMRMGKGRLPSGTVYGRVVHKVPPFRVQDVVERNRAFEEVARLYGTVQRGADVPRRRITAFRYGGGAHVPPLPITPQTGSFQHLKELIRTERARELQEQRIAEEAAARAAALKEMSNGNRERHRQQNLRDTMRYSYDMGGEEGRDRERDEQRESLATSRMSGVLAFPDLLAPAARSDMSDVSYAADSQDYQRAAFAPHRSPYGSSSYSDDLDSELML